MDNLILNSYSKISNINVSRETCNELESLISMIQEKNKDIKINCDTNGNSPFFSKIIRILFQHTLKKDLLALYKILKSSRKNKSGLKKVEQLILNSGLLKAEEYNSKVIKIIKELKKDKY